MKRSEILDVSLCLGPEKSHCWFEGVCSLCHNRLSNLVLQSCLLAILSKRWTQWRKTTVILLFDTIIHHHLILEPSPNHHQLFRKGPPFDAARPGTCVSLKVSRPETLQGPAERGDPWLEQLEQLSRLDVDYHWYNVWVYVWNVVHLFLVIYWIIYIYIMLDAQ